MSFQKKTPKNQSKIKQKQYVMRLKVIKAEEKREMNENANQKN